MATATATILSSSLSIKPTANINQSKSSSPKRITKVKYVTGLNSFGGLKAQNNAVSSLGLPVSTEKSYAMIVSSLHRPKRGGGGGGGGALSSTCNATAEIFKIAAIMNGLTLVGVAVGFVLLRIEAAVEESE